MANIDDFQQSAPVFAMPTPRTAPSADELFQSWVDQGLIAGLGAGSDSSAGEGARNARASRSAVLKQLSIQRKKLEFQQKTGLRDISQARTKGLRGAINNALQRGIFNSGIRIENASEVNREADEAKSDLKTDIQFALDDLAARREGVAAQRFGSGGGGGGEPPLTIAEADFNATEEAKFQRERVKNLNQDDLEHFGKRALDGSAQPTQPNNGVVQIPRSGPQ